MKLKTMAACAVMFSGIFFSSQALALDELYLCGVVTGINAKDGLVTINVTSESCLGLRTFKLPAKKRLSLKVDERKFFYIDSNRCRPGYTYTITKTVPE